MLLMTVIDLLGVLWPTPVLDVRWFSFYRGIELFWLDDHTLALCTSI